MCKYRDGAAGEGLPWWLRGNEPACQCRRCGFNLWVRTIPLEKAVATRSSILAWEIPWAEELVGYSAWGHKELNTT